MNTVAKILLLFLVLLSLNSEAQTSSDRLKVVGYYSLKSAMANPKDVPFKKLTHVNLWFLNPDTLGNFTVDLSGLKSFVKSAHQKKVKVLFSIGGGSPQPQYHYLLKDDRREELIDNLVQQVIKYDIDGVDVDLEGSNIDLYYEKFVIELGSKLRSYDKLLTAAIAIYYKDQLTDNALAQFDFVNVMSYDRTGPWRPDKPGPHATYEHAIEDLDYFGNVRKIPKEKMTLGVPFYGYGYGPELTSSAISMDFGTIVKTFKGSEIVDRWTMPDGKIIYYNGIPTIKRKTALAKEKAAGVMIWQIRGDAKGPKSLLKVIHKELKK
jgi:GH18 family chitinase